MSEATLPKKAKLNAFDPRLGEIWKRGALSAQRFELPDTKTATRFLFRLNQYRRAAEHDKHPEAPLFRKAVGKRKGNIVTIAPVTDEFAAVLDELPPITSLGGVPSAQPESPQQEEAVSIDELLKDVKNST